MRVGTDNQKKELCANAADCFLVDSQISLRRLLDLLPAFIKIGSPDGNFDFLNKQWLDYTGLSLAEVKGMNWISAIHPDDVAEVAENWSHSVSTGTPVYHESRVRRFDGEYHWFLHRHAPIRDDHGRIIMWVGSSIDIEERKQAEQRAIDSEREFRRSVDTIPALVFTALPDGAMDFSNLRSLEFSGRTPEDFREWHWAENGIVHPEDVPRLLEEQRASISSREPLETEARLRRYDAEFRWFRIGFAPLLDESQEVIKWCGVCIDIDAQKHAEAQVRRDEQELRQLIDLVPQQIFVLSPDGTPVYANRVALEYTGLTLEESLSMSISNRIFHPDDAERVIEEQRRKVALGSSFEMEARLRRKDGEYRWFLIQLNPLLDEDGRIIHWYGSRTDIHDRKQVEESTLQENIVLREEVDKASMFEEVVGASRAIRSVLRRVSKVAPTNSTVLLTGETGTGKELIARAIHKRSQRKGRAFISVNCAAIPQSLIASELFGHEKGAFTGANQRRLGRFELADRGTIFLDEVGDLPAETQVALLRVLQEQEIERVGGSRPIRIDVRVVAATNRNLEAAIAEEKFRSDLYYRLNVFPVEIPALRERKDDVPLLVEYFIERYARQAGRKIRPPSLKTMDLLVSYSWPGNVRELQNVVQRSLIVCESDVFTVDESWLVSNRSQNDRNDVPLATTLAAREIEMIETALANSRGRVAGPNGAATKLGVPVSTLESRIKSLNIDKYRFKSL
ncbi:MAG: sigma 54-interacting transcriptional regulator [Pyrinomonadaceae bacterium]